MYMLQWICVFREYEYYLKFSGIHRVWYWHSIVICVYDVWFRKRKTLPIDEVSGILFQSAQKCRSHAFNPMNRDQRRVVHELAEYYGCTTQSYDEEPKKNVVATAYKLVWHY